MRAAFPVLAALGLDEALAVVTWAVSVSTGGAVAGTSAVTTGVLSLIALAEGGQTSAALPAGALDGAMTRPTAVPTANAVNTASATVPRERPITARSLVSSDGGGGATPDGGEYSAMDESEPRAGAMLESRGLLGCEPRPASDRGDAGTGVGPAPGGMLVPAASENDGSEARVEGGSEEAAGAMGLPAAAASGFAPGCSSRCADAVKPGADRSGARGGTGRR